MDKLLKELKSDLWDIREKCGFDYSDPYTMGRISMLETVIKKIENSATMKVKSVTTRPPRVCSTCRHSDVDEYGYYNCGRKSGIGIVGCSDWMEDF